MAPTREEDGQCAPSPVFCLMRVELMESLVKFTQGGRPQDRRLDGAVTGWSSVLFDDAAAFANANTPAELQQLQRHA